ncbi:DNA/RNA polymerase [Tuber magnatum]|uniref:DNA-directed RNA polymerase n=1 Tax=Tuber magnatum TaxID=42249 RepID=A0A317SPS5_9PEZI|nr:DNA/RNA polymerase [Tuber magnatum]
MLRAASRGIHRRIVRQNSCVRSTFETPRIPRLCASPYAYHEPIRWSSSNARSVSLPSETSPKSIDRSYSTAAAALELSDIDTSAIFPPLRQDATPYSIPIEPLEPLEPSQLLVFENWVAPDEKCPRKSVAGIPSDKGEVLATFNACINVGMVARAQLILEQITKKSIEEGDTTVLVEAHNAFLKTLLDQYSSERGNLRELKVFFMWFENKMRAEYIIKGDATTFALLLKASLKIAVQDARKKYLDEYISLWKHGGGKIADVLQSRMLSNEEVLDIAKICRLKIHELSATCQEVVREHRKSYPTPEIFGIQDAKPTPVKGQGLAAVKSSLRSLIDLDHIPLREHDMDMNDAEFQIERQKLLEEHAFDSARERWRKDFETLSERGIIRQGKELSSLLWEWHQALVPLIKEEILRVHAAEVSRTQSAGSVDRCLYGPFLRLMEPEKIAAITMIELLQAHTINGAAVGLKASRAVLRIGREMELEFLAQEVGRRRIKGGFGQMSKADLAELFRDKLAFRQSINKARKSGDPDLGELPEWPVTVRAKLGAVLISMLIHVAKIPVKAAAPGSIEGSGSSEEIVQNLPAFYHCYEYLRGRKLGVIKLHPELIRRLGSDDLNLTVMGKSLPMVVRPLPWTDWDEGGYYYTRSRVVRIKESFEQKIYVEAAARKGHLDQLFAGLDVLGRTAWRINRKVFDVVLDIWNRGEEFAEIPALDMDVKYPLEPEPTADPKVRWEWIQEMKRLDATRRNNHSTRCDVNFKVEIARAFLFEKFYFPHNIDFRGRAYPIPPNLNHIGNDLSRGLLMFAEGKEVGEAGLKWMKIHLANLAGYDKASFTDRVGYTEENMELIHDSARNPLTGKGWWLKSEDPWQLLASCFALSEALSLPDATKYLCHLPVAQDGTCNGLQHYAALGGDVAGARQVNLEPSDKPQDVYTGVAELVKASIQLDMESGRREAIALKGLVTRKVVKQTVMTNVYGVTFIGARAQIESRLKDIESLNRKDIPGLSLYLTKKVFDSIQEMFSGASAIQHWLATCAKKISRSVGPNQLEHLGNLDTGGDKNSVHFMTSVVWTTPLGLPVVQPYRQLFTTAVSTNLQTVHISNPYVVNKVDSRKQMTAFPPNFIHSLDASHMLLSALNCDASGLTFASVHDSFWTHPSDVDLMNRILRDAFVALHGKGLMQNLRAEFEERYKGFRTLAKIMSSTECGKEIKRARRSYAVENFRRSNLTEVEDLQWEIKRWVLMQSPDSDDRKKAAEMVTPSVILENYGGLQANELREDAGKLGSGEGEEEDAPPDDDMVLADMEEGSRMPGTAGNEGVDSGGAPTKKRSRARKELDEDGDGDTIPRDSESVKKTSKRKALYNPTLNVWVELKFPELPPKGEFDVSKLKNSQYFFS